MNIQFPQRRAIFFLIVGALQSVFAERVKAGDLWFHHGAYYQFSVSSGQTIMLVPATSMTGVQIAPVATHHLMFSPVTTTQLMSHSLQLSTASTGQTLQLTPSTSALQTLQYVSPLAAYQTLQLSPSTLSLSPQVTHFVVSSPSATTLTPQSSGAQTLTLGTGGSTDIDTAYYVLMLGFNNQRSKLDAFEGAIKKKLGDLINAGGNALSNPDLTSILVSIAKDFLKTPESGFASLIVNDALEPFLSKVISNIVQNRTGGQTDGAPTPPGQNKPAQLPQTNVPAGGVSFDVSGRIVLTPTGGVPVSAPNGKQANGQTQAPTTDLKSDPGGSVAPEIP